MTTFISAAVMLTVFTAGFVAGCLITFWLCRPDSQPDMLGPVDLTTWSVKNLEREWFACAIWIDEGDHGASVRQAEVVAELQRRKQKEI